jgi:ubiquinone/menaquinone biosynthesis C-methylase UbiE
VSRLNAAEYAMMQSPVRRLAQRHLELRAFLRLLRRAGVDLRGGQLLDAGCGSGYGLELLYRTFLPGRLVGFDLMPEQVARARRRGIDPEIVEVRVGDVTAIDEPAASFDGAFVFGILHHVPAWRTALVELARVLRPGGVLLVEELHGDFVDLEDCALLPGFLRTSHPKEARFDWPTFRAGLAAAGLRIEGEIALVPGAARSFLARKLPSGA